MRYIVIIIISRFGKAQAVYLCADFSSLSPCSERMVLPLWRSLHSLNLMLPKEDRKAMLLRLYNEDTPLMDHSKDRFYNNNPKPQPDADIKDEVDDVKDEDEIDADIKDEMAVKEEDEGEIFKAAAVGENGDREDDALPDSPKEEVEDGV